VSIMADSGIVKNETAEGQADVTQSAHPTPVLNTRLLTIMTVATCLAVANTYYNQPMLGLFIRDFGATPREVAVIPFLSQIGYAIGLFFLAPLGDRVERKTLIIATLLGLSLALTGAAIAVVGAYLLAHMSPDTTRIALLRNTVITGFGLAIIMPIYNLTVQNAAHVAMLGVATSMVYFVRYISSSIGVAVYGTILITHTKSAGLASALNSVFWVIAGLVVTVFVATIFLRDIPLRRSNVEDRAALE